MREFEKSSASGGFASRRESAVGTANKGRGRRAHGRKVLHQSERISLTSGYAALGLAP